MINTYKRLTNKNLDEFNPKHDFCIGCEYFGEPNGCNRWNGARAQIAKRKGAEPYHKNDITCKRLDDCLDKYGMLEI